MKKYGWMGIAVLALGLGMQLMAAPKTRISSDYDKFINFQTLKTWSWHPSPPQDQSLFEPEVHAALREVIETNLAKRGFTKATTGPGDFYVYYNVTKQNEVQKIRMNHGRGEVTEVEQHYEAGTLFLDMSNPTTNTTIWRGWIQAELKPDQAMEKRKKRADSALKDLLKTFPPNK